MRAPPNEWADDRYQRMRYLRSTENLQENSTTSSVIARYDSLALRITLRSFGSPKISLR
jgi:hypothetical protein